MAVTQDAGPSVVLHSDDTKHQQRRLHVSGLNPVQCSRSDLEARFSSFGLAVSDVVNWPPKDDAVGQKTTWCFLTVTGQESAIKRTMAVLHNAMWKGSKIRIGLAKADRRRQTEGEDEKFTAADEKTAAYQAEKRRRKLERARRRQDIQGVEDAGIGSVVTTEDVDAGLWGWKKTPNGHLVRPMHMRPDRPLPKPSKAINKQAAPREGESKGASGDDDKSVLKRKRQIKAISRARPTTIDPSRYHTQHLSGKTLDVADDRAIPEGAVWQCEEDECKDGKVVWSLVDRSGQILQSEHHLMHSQQSKQHTDAFEAQSHQQQSPEERPTDDFDILNEVDAAIDQAQLSSDSEADQWIQAGHQTNINDTFVTAQESPAAHGAFPRFDPDEEENFSDGYQEDIGDESNSAVIFDGQSEKRAHLGILRSILGDGALQPDASATREQSKSVLDFGSDESGYDRQEDEEGDMTMEKPSRSRQDNGRESSILPISSNQDSKAEAQQTQSAAARRAALLGLLTPAASQQTGHFKPIERFDPGLNEEAQEEENDDNEKLEDRAPEAKSYSSDTGLEAHARNTIPSREEGHVQMTTLTDMFRPKEDKGVGFSLLDELDLDLDEDLDFGAEEGASVRIPDELEGAVEGEATYSGYPSDQLPHAALRRRPAFFPSTDENGQICPGDNSVFGIVLHRLRASGFLQGNIASFFQPEDEATLARKWSARKANLTQAYKRRHREALKKKRRKFVGSRMGGGISSAR